MHVVGKPLERYVGEKLLTYLENHDLLSHAQYGFRRRRCTAEAIFDYLGRILKFFDKNTPTIAIHLDLRKAFDTISHSLLIEKLPSFFLHENLIDWVKDYLSNRSSIVMFDNQKSDPLTVSVGVPQGSVLGPLLFLLYINDLPSLKLNSYISLYADDTLLLNANSDERILHNELQEDLENIGNWMNFNKLSVNVKKSETILYATTPIQPSTLNFRLEDFNIKKHDPN